MVCLGQGVKTAGGCDWTTVSSMEEGRQQVLLCAFITCLSLIGQKKMAFSLLSQWAFRSRGQGAGSQSSSRQGLHDFKANRETPGFFFNLPPKTLKLKSGKFLFFYLGFSRLNRLQITRVKVKKKRAMSERVKASYFISFTH